ncbi:MAG: serine/threonine protein phosphatase [Clostridia bacterium]|nr:serine/threonine protein phosphatase [Clostridia bacterium]
MKLPQLWKTKRSEVLLRPLQTGPKQSHPFGSLDRYVPLCRSEFALYDAIREAVPIVDAAIGKITALTGGFRVECDHPALQKELDVFLENVPVGSSLYGIDAFVTQHLEQLLMYGTSVGEILPTASGQTIGALHNVPLNSISIEQDDRTGQAVICAAGGGQAVPLPYQQLMVMSALNPKPGQVCGNSLLKGLPFVTGILLKIYNTIGVNFERMGNLRFAVTYKPSKETAERGSAKDRARQIAEEWQKAMRTSSDGKISDFVAIGDVDIRVIGADNQVMDSQVPVRQMLEQIVAKTGIPPFMLGLSWSATERMSSQQADMLTSELWAYRRQLTPVIKKIANLWLRMQGVSGGCRVVWDEISLQDEVASANAAYTRAQTRLLEKQLEGEE